MLPQSFTPEFLRQLELVKIRSRRQFLGSRQGGHVSLKKGHGIEFSDYREYELGDNPRHIDWGVYARSERLYVKKYQEEQDLNVYIILDTSRSMLMPEAESKWPKAVEIALALAYVALMEQDSVTLLAPGYLRSPSYYGGRAIHQLSKSLMQLAPTGHEDFVTPLRAQSARLKFPGVAVVISDLLMPQAEIREAFNLLRSRNLDITAIQLLSQGEKSPLPATESARVVDSETGEELDLALTPEFRQDYAILLSDHLNAVREFLNSSRIPLVETSNTEPLASFITQNLLTIGLLR